MDPNAALADIRSMLASLPEAEDADEFYAITDDVVSTFAALDEWIARGGFLPTAWQHSQAPASDVTIV